MAAAHPRVQDPGGGGLKRVQLYAITGASRGIGASLLKCVAALADTEALAVSRSGLSSPVARCEDLRCDLSTREGQRAAAEALRRKIAERRWHKAVLINNAGMVEPVAPLERADLDEFLRAFALNVMAPAALMQAFLSSSNGIAERSIINISSGVSHRPVQGWAAYCSSKAALDMLSQVAVAEAQAAGGGVRIASLYPGLVDTAMQDLIRTVSEADFPSVQEFHDWKAQGALQNPDSVAERILTLERERKLPQAPAFLHDL